MPEKIHVPSHYLGLSQQQVAPTYHLSLANAGLLPGHQPRGEEDRLQPSVCRCCMKPGMRNDFKREKFGAGLNCTPDLLHWVHAGCRSAAKHRAAELSADVHVHTFRLQRLFGRLDHKRSFQPAGSRRKNKGTRALFTIKQHKQFTFCVNF